jgi:Zn-dependent membrane protease YugP
MLALRSNLVPVVQFGSNLAPIVLTIGLGLAYMGHNLIVLLAGIVLFAASTLFAFITLPVEFDASRRALEWLERSGAAEGLSHQQAKDALFWAAMTYVVAALASLGQLLYYIMLFMRARDRRG